jgi:hypothetical protein
LLGLASPSLSVAGAHFVAGTVEPGRTPVNSVTYDLRPASPVVRCVVPRDGVWVAQVAVDFAAERRLDATAVAPWVCSLLDVPVGSCDATVTSYPFAYPLEPPPAPFLSAIDDRCRSAGVQRRGRFAEWRYIDLHEVTW